MRAAESYPDAGRAGQLRDARLRDGLPYWAGLYLLLAAVRSLSGSGAAGPTLLVAEVGLAALFAGFYFVLSRRTVGPPLFAASATALFACSAVYAGARLALEGAINDAALFAIVAASAPFFTSSFRGFAATTAISAACWLTVAVGAGFTEQVAFAAAGFPLACLVFRRNSRGEQPTQSGSDAPAADGPSAGNFRGDHRELAVDGSNDGLWHLDVAGGALSVSAGFAAMLGNEPGEIGTRLDDWTGLIHTQHVARFKSDLDAHLSGRQQQFENAY